MSEESKNSRPAYSYSFLYKTYRQADEARMYEMSEEEVAEEMSKVGVSLLAVSNEFGCLMGKLLTFVDASFDDPQRRKAFKDMVRSIVHDTESELFMLSDGKKIS